MAAPRKYPDELRERARRFVAEAMAEDPSLSLNAAVKRVGPRVGIVPDTLRGWIKQARIDSGQAPGMTTNDAKTIKELQAEVRELPDDRRVAGRPHDAHRPAPRCPGHGPVAPRPRRPHRRRVGAPQHQ